MYLEFLFRRAHSRKRGERKYWSGESLYSRTTCSNSVIVGVIGPIGSGLPQFGFPRLLAMKTVPFLKMINSAFSLSAPKYRIPGTVSRIQEQIQAECRTKQIPRG